MRSDINRPSQRTVSARTAPALVTTGTRSAFDIPQAPKKPHAKRKVPPPIDAASIPIEHGMPVTESPSKRVGHSRYEPLLVRLDVGASAVVPLAHASSLLSAAKAYGKRIGAVFMVHAINETEARIWRTE